MALGRYYSQDNLKNILKMLLSKDDHKNDDLIFLESIAPVLANLKDYFFVTSFILGMLNAKKSNLALNPFHPYASENTEVGRRISKIFAPVFINVITNIDRLVLFLEELDDKQPDGKNILKPFRSIFADEMRHAIRDATDLEKVLPLLAPNERLPFALKQNEYWFVYQKNCRMAFLSGRSPKSTETYTLFKSIDRNIFLKIFQEAELLPKPKAIRPTVG